MFKNQRSTPTFVTIFVKNVAKSYISSVHSIRALTYPAIRCRPFRAFENVKGGNIESVSLGREMVLSSHSIDAKPLTSCFLQRSDLASKRNFLNIKKQNLKESFLIRNSKLLIQKSLYLKTLTRGAEFFSKKMNCLLLKLYTEKL